MARHIVPEAEALLDKQFPVLDHGFVILVDYMGSDAAIAEAARQSVAGENTRKSSDDRALIRYLMAQGHTSPFEMVEFKFHCAMPIFVARQWIRHRTANVNEQSGRYGEMPELVYIPEVEHIAYQNSANRQGRSAVVVNEVVAVNFRNKLREDADEAFRRYHDYLGCRRPDEQGSFPDGVYAEVQKNGGISRELARINLPLSTYTQWYWKIDLHNLLHFLFLRLDEHAQWEIRQYAQVMAKMVQVVCPVAWEAFVDYRQKAIKLSDPEVRALRALVEQYALDGAVDGGHTGAPGVLRAAGLNMSNREVEAFRKKLGPDGLGLGFLNSFAIED